MSVSNSSFLDHVLNSSLRNILEQICEKKERIDDHFPEAGLLPIQFILLVAPINVNGNFSSRRQPWACDVGQHMLEVGAQWRHCKNPLVLEEDGHLHTITSGQGATLYKCPPMDEVYICSKEADHYGTEANMLLSLDKLEILLASEKINF